MKYCKIDKATEKLIMNLTMETTNNFYFTYNIFVKEKIRINKLK
jgi:hypothetical protein